MQPATFHKLWTNPWFRGALVLYLLSTFLLAAGHQHHGLQDHDCALCTAAHTPAMAAAAIDLQAAPTIIEYLLHAPGDQRWDSEPDGTTRSRAPPLA
jgi:hypothetical protein